MTLQRRGGISMERLPMGLVLDSGQTRSSARQKTVSEKLQHWLSRSASSTHSLPPPPSSTHSLPPSQVNTEERGRLKVEQGRRLGRPTKASLLRMSSAPVAYVQPNYHEMVKKRKQFALRCKSASVPVILSHTLPPGESLHSFLTGARYNSAHHVDTRSLDRLGVYIPRGDASRVFVNPAGTIPPSPTIYGLKRRSRNHRMSDTHTSMSAPSIHTTDLHGYTLTKYISDARCVTTRIDQEIEQVFGPDQGSIGSDSVLGQCEEDSEGSSQQLSVEENGGGEGEKEIEERAASSISVSKSFEELQNFSDFEGSQGFDVASLAIHSVSKEVESSAETESNVSNSSTINGTHITVESESTMPTKGFAHNFEMENATSQTSPDTQNVGSDTQNIGSDTQNIGSDTQNIGSDTQNIGSDTQNIGSDTQNIGSDTQNIGSDTQNVASDTQNVGSDTQNVASDTQNIGSDTQNVGSGIRKREDEPEPLDLISPTAQKMTDDILRECSSSSVNSAETSATETAPQKLQRGADDIQTIDRGLQTSFVKATPSPQSGESISPAASSTNDRPSSGTTSRPQSAGSQLASGRSSHIFVDLISLQTPQTDQD